MPADYLRPQSPELTEVRFECLKCGVCCRQPDIIITVTGHDVARLARGLNLSPPETLRALDFYLLDTVEIVPLGLREIPAVMTEHGLAYMALKKIDDGSCVFLSDDLCLIHAIRPSACVSFPFTFRVVAGSIMWGLSAKKELCPGIGKGEPVSELELYQLAAPVIEELSLYSEFVSQWNASEIKHTAAGFVKAILESPLFA
ncbi:MAG: YkgJ family cysteine cluster protein [Candidatus Thorarchaeota archaeon]|nr:YkgJ family cysteine cluster protein [Candidatus Thorarchaeota archaeon]